jgi:Ca2+-binding EF-hand superfamily protein
MIPNKTNEQILYQQFKYFDLDSTGYCTLQNFVRVQNRIGVVLPKIKDLEIIFNYFSDSESSLLNYKKFCKDIFNYDASTKKVQMENEAEGEKDFISLLIYRLLSKGGAFTLLDLIKNLQIIDFEGNKRINSDEFLTGLQRCGIKLDSNEIQSLFLGHDFFTNGVVKYQILINLLLDQFWDEKKNSISEEIYFNLTNGGKRQMTLNDMKNYFDRILEDSPDKKNLLIFIDKYKIINKNRINQYLTMPDMIKFLQFYGFGQKSYNFLDNLLSVLEPEYPKEKVKYDLNNFEKEYEPKKYDVYKSNYNSSRKNEMGYIFQNLREKIFNFSRKTFFNFIKHFKYYDDNTNDITIYNFSKVLKDFNLNLSTDEIEAIFNIYGSNKKIKSMKYRDFIDDLVSEFINKKRDKIIRYIYGTIEERGNKFNRDLDLSFLKEVYNPKKNYFIKEEGENRLEFEDCLELFHYIYKGNKNELFKLNDFVDFYKCMSFLVYSDDDFMKLLSNEWRVPIEYIEKEIFDEQDDKYNYINNKSENNLYKEEINNIKNEDNDNVMNDVYQTNKNKIDNNINQKKPNLIEKLINNDFGNDNITKENEQESLRILNSILKNRGLRGILYLHLEFINSCQDLSKITFDDFVNVIQIQHIGISDLDCKYIFKKFSSKTNENYLDFLSFIRNFKKELNENKLSSVEQAFSFIDINEKDLVPLNVIKKKFKADKHPDVSIGKRNEEEIILEFLDCFNINYEILNLDSKSQTSNNGQNLIDFEIFANFYEYVSFIYPNDKDFDAVVSSSWN